MPSKRKPTSKKKKKNHNRNEAMISCKGCSLPINGDEYINCLCTEVRYCSESCMRHRPHQACPGLPALRVDMEAKLNEINTRRRNDQSISMLMEQKREIDETVHIPFKELLISKGAKFIKKDLTAEDFAELADEGDGPGNQACAYLAGVKYKHRMLGKTTIGRRSNKLVVDNSGLDIAVLESQELAFRYFERGSKLGHCLSMQSLGECYDNGIGCRENRRKALKWMWRSYLLNNGIGESYEMVESRSLLPLELKSQVDMMHQFKQYAKPFQTINVGGPNLASILSCLLPVIVREKFSLPPFAGSKPSCTVGNPVVPNDGEKPRVSIIGYKTLKRLKLVCDSIYEERGNETFFTSGRRGAMKASTAQTRGNGERSLDNQVFFVPPTPATDESVSNDELDAWVSKIKKLIPCKSSTKIVITTLCTHLERNKKREPSVFCLDCAKEASERLWAVSRGKVALSENENIPHYGQAAIFERPDGSIAHETWKSYAGGDAECILATIVLNKENLYCNPIYIAQDPNFFWPLIADHGCIRAAFEFVAPHIDWNSVLGVVKAIPTQHPIVFGASPGKNIRKCGNDICHKLEEFSTISTVCSGCHRRKYCSVDCYIEDWHSHKRECKAASKGMRPLANDTNPETLNNEDVENPKHFDEPLIDCDVVINNLVAKPEYNGKVGLILGDIKDGRFPIMLRTKGKKEILVKPQNISLINAFSRNRRGKSTIYECVHGLELCSKCYFDFSIVNRMGKLKYNGDRITESMLDLLVDSHYASVKDSDAEETTCFLNKDLPLECHGMDQYPQRRLILKALLETEVDMTVYAMAARAAMVSFGARMHNAIRPNVSTHIIALSSKDID